VPDHDSGNTKGGLASARLWDDDDWLLEPRQEPHLFGAGNASGLAVPELARALKILPHSPQLMGASQTNIHVMGELCIVTYPSLDPS
jgi:hypothetical protein